MTPSGTSSSQPWERVLWTGGPSRLTPGGWRGTRIAISDVRVVVTTRTVERDLALDDIGDIRLVHGTWDRLARAATLVLEPRRGGPALVLPGLRRGEQIAALLHILSASSDAAVDPTALRDLLAWRRLEAGRVKETVGAIGIVAIAIAAGVLGLHGTEHAIAYADDDPIYPGGHKRSVDAIMRFMEREVLPFAQTALGPLKGGAGRVTCATCHGPDASARGYQMPGVAALPDPGFKDGGWERYSAAMDAQLRNAVYGYLADEEKQRTATYMREVVMPGMAKLLRRPAYDFARSYDYNRAHAAFGCYHCHRME